MLPLETLIELLLPSWLEVQIAVAAAAFVVVAYWLFTVGGGSYDRMLVGSSASVADVNDEKEEVFSVTY